MWKVELQKLADQTGLHIAVCHFPPGTSKWNKIEHRLFAHISMNWRGRPLISHEVIVDLIGATTTRAGLRVQDPEGDPRHLGELLVVVLGPGRAALGQPGRRRLGDDGRTRAIEDFGMAAKRAGRRTGRIEQDRVERQQRAERRRLRLGPQGDEVGLGRLAREQALKSEQAKAGRVGRQRAPGRGA